METFRHHPFIRAFAALFNIAAFVFPIWISYRFISTAVTAGREIAPGKVVEILLLAGFSSLVLLLTANYFPEVKTDEGGLYVSFVWRRLRVPFKDLVQLKPDLMERLLRPSDPRIWVVATRSLTPFHRLYGILYAFWLHPSFILHSSLQSTDRVLEIIRSKIPSHAQDA